MLSISGRRHTCGRPGRCERICRYPFSNESFDVHGSGNLGRLKDPRIVTPSGQHYIQW